jgi:hypothetical protein
MGYAEFSMKNVGRVAPTFLVQTPDGILAYFQTKWGGGEPLAEMTFGAYGALRQWNPEQTRLNGRHDG